MPGDVRQTVRREFDRLLMDEERDRDARALTTHVSATRALASCSKSAH